MAGSCPWPSRGTLVLVIHDLAYGLERLPGGRKRERLAAFADGQIAAIAATNDLVLVTRNSRDFASFPGRQLLDWFSEP